TPVVDGDGSDGARPVGPRVLVWRGVPADVLVRHQAPSSTWTMISLSRVLAAHAAILPLALLALLPALVRPAVLALDADHLDGALEAEEHARHVDGALHDGAPQEAGEQGGQDDEAEHRREQEPCAEHVAPDGRAPPVREGGVDDEEPEPGDERTDLQAVQKDVHDLVPPVDVVDLLGVVVDARVVRQALPEFEHLIRLRDNALQVLLADLGGALGLVQFPVAWVRLPTEGHSPPLLFLDAVSCAVRWRSPFSACLMSMSNCFERSTLTRCSACHAFLYSSAISHSRTTSRRRARSPTRGRRRASTKTTPTASEMSRRISTGKSSVMVSPTPGMGS